MKASELYQGPTLTMEQILLSRSERTKQQRIFLAQGGMSLLSFTMNIPGNIKQFPAAKNAFEIGFKTLQERLPLGSILTRFQRHFLTGSEGLLLLSLPALEVKKLAVELEDFHPLGRLFDMDVLSQDGNAISRTELGIKPRTCLICNENAKICARSRAHSHEVLQQKIVQILEQTIENS